LQIVGETLCEAVDIAAGEDVLDVAAGNGNASLAAARRGAIVTASDYVPALLNGTLARAAAEGLTIDAQEADAEAMPFADDSFDVVLSTFGVMFTPNQDRSAAELVRVCRPGGRIGLANWTPDGFIGKMFKIVGRYVRRRLASTRRSSGAPRLGSPSCSDRSAPRCRSAARSSSSATARRRTGSTRSASSTVPR
jgi:ubiquinone/menaquinone biosynthesis C-methylase UbiE